MTRAHAIAKVKRSSRILYTCWTVSLISTIMHVVTVHVREIYGSFYGEFDACANSVYQALSPPLKGPGDEASFHQGINRLASFHYTSI